MALAKGTVRLAHEMAPQWFKVSTQVTPATAGTSIQWSLNTMQQINSNASKNGLKAYFVGMSIVRHANVTLGEGTANAFSAQVNREAYFSVNIQQPNVSTKYMKQNTNLALLGQLSRTINPAMVALADNLPPKQGLYQDMFAASYGLSASIKSSPFAFAQDRFSSLSVESWGDNYNFQSVGSEAGGDVDFVDATTIPACQYSGNSKHGSWLDKDILPLPLLTNNNMPWVVTLNTLIDLNNQFDTGTITKDVCELWILVSFRKDTAAIRSGLLWSIQQTPIGPGNYNPMPLLYRGIYCVPTYDAATVTEGGIRLPYAPLDFYAFASTAQIRLIDTGDQVFPLDNYSEAQKFLDHYNDGSRLGGNPKCRWSYYGTPASTVYALDTIDGSFVGDAAGLPFFPLVANHLFIKGFGVGFMADPQDSSTRLQITYTTPLPVTGEKNVFSVHVSEFYDHDSPIILAYGLFGDANQPAGSRMPSIIPLTDNVSARSMLVRKLVPWEAPV